MISDEVEESVKREPTCHDPHAYFETDGSQSGEQSEEGYLK